MQIPILKKAPSTVFILLCLPLSCFGIDPGLLEGKWLTIGTARSDMHLFQLSNGTAFLEFDWHVTKQSYTVDENMITFRSANSTDSAVYEIMNLTTDSLTLMALNRLAKREWYIMNGVYQKTKFLRLYRLTAMKFQFDSIVFETQSKAIPYQTYYSPSVQIRISVSYQGNVTYDREVLDTGLIKSEKRRINFGNSCPDVEKLSGKLAEKEIIEFQEKIYSSGILRIDLQRDFPSYVRGGYHSAKTRLTLFHTGKVIKEISTADYPRVMEPLVSFIYGAHNVLHRGKN